jgi:hypothetical protein
MMRARRPAAFEMLSVSALDLFASALGSFMLLAIVLFPYYLRSPAWEAEVRTAQAGRDQAQAAARAAAAEAAEQERRQAAAGAALDRAKARLHAAEAAARLWTPGPAPPPEPPPAPAVTASARMHGLAVDDLDLVFVMDATGSMRDELRDAQANLIGIVRVLSRLTVSLRVGFVVYKDRSDAFVTRSFPLSPMRDGGVEALVAFLAGITADGGGDPPEPIDVALADAVALSWRPQATGRIVVIGDAPVHGENTARTLTLARAFAGGGPPGRRNVSAVFTGGDPQAGAFFVRLADAGGGLFARHQGQMIESVLLSVLHRPRAAEGRR